MLKDYRDIENLLDGANDSTREKAIMVYNNLNGSQLFLLMVQLEVEKENGSIAREKVIKYIESKI